MKFAGRLVLGFLLGMLMQFLGIFFLLIDFRSVEYLGGLQVLYVAPAAFVLHLRAQSGYAHGVLLAGTTVALIAVWYWAVLLLPTSPGLLHRLFRA